MTCDRKVLFLLAHQDDEIFVATRISFELRRGRSPYLVYLTNGASTAQNVAVRDQESRMFLRHLGIAPEQVVFLGSEFQIPDGYLVNRFEKWFELLLEKVEGHMFDEIYAPAWEGGHQKITMQRFSSASRLLAAWDSKSTSGNSIVTMASTRAAVFFGSSIPFQRESSDASEGLHSPKDLPS